MCACMSERIRLKKIDKRDEIKNQNKKMKVYAKVKVKVKVGSRKNRLSPKCHFEINSF